VAKIQDPSTTDKSRLNPPEFFPKEKMMRPLIQARVMPSTAKVNIN